MSFCSTVVLLLLNTLSSSKSLCPYCLVICSHALTFLPIQFYFILYRQCFNADNELCKSAVYMMYQMINIKKSVFYHFYEINVTNVPLSFLVHCTYCHVKNTIWMALLHHSNISTDIKILIINHITSRHAISLHLGVAKRSYDSVYFVQENLTQYISHRSDNCLT